MGPPIHNTRQHLQLERVVLFSDAVFAIAITLLIIEIKVPAANQGIVTDSDLIRSIGLLIPKFIGFIISFMMVGLYWTRHHTLFGYVVGLTPRLIWLNLFFLLSIVLMPFSTAVFGEYSTPRLIGLVTPLIIYVLNICFSALMLFLLWGYVAAPSHGVSDQTMTSAISRDARARAAIIALVFALAIPVAFVNPYAARDVPLLIPIAIRIVSRKRGKHKHP